MKYFRFACQVNTATGSKKAKGGRQGKVKVHGMSDDIHGLMVTPGPCLDANFFPKFYYAKRRFSVTSKCRHMYRLLNVDEIKN
jgi:hypothetical protein